MVVRILKGQRARLCECAYTPVCVSSDLKSSTAGDLGLKVSHGCLHLYPDRQAQSARVSAGRTALAPTHPVWASFFQDFRNMVTRCGGGQSRLGWG